MLTACRLMISARLDITPQNFFSLCWKCYICPVRAAHFTLRKWNLFRYKWPAWWGIWKSSHINVIEVTEYLAHRETDIWGDSTDFHIFERLLYICFLHISLYVVQKVISVWTLEVIGSRVWYLWGSKNLVTTRIAWTRRSSFWQVF